MKTALITGIAGQDGSYLAELLLAKGYEVHGLVRRVGLERESDRYSRILSIKDRLHLHLGEVDDYPTLARLLETVKPDELYHLAAQSQVQVSFEDDFGTFRTNFESTHFLLSLIKERFPKTKMYFAATSEMFGDVAETPQRETTPLRPVSPYGISKTAAYFLVKCFRGAYGIFAVSGVLFNHESPRRGFEFVTRKISRAAAEIKLGRAKELRLGNLDAKRDWGFAGDYVEAMWLMLQQDAPDDYVIGTGENHTVREFVEAAFGRLGLDWQRYVTADPSLARPVEVHTLLADPAKAKRVLGWAPKTGFTDLVAMMVDADLNDLQSPA